MVAKRIVLSGRGSKAGKRVVFNSKPKPNGVTKRVIVSQKSNGPALKHLKTLDERFTILQQMRERAESQRLTSREQLLEKKRGRKVASSELFAGQNDTV